MLSHIPKQDPQIKDHSVSISGGTMPKAYAKNRINVQSYRNLFLFMIPYCPGFLMPTSVPR